MSSGQKAMYEDMEDERCRKVEERLKTWTAEDLRRVLEHCWQEFDWVGLEDIPLTRIQYSRLDTIRAHIDKLLRGKAS